MSKTFVVQQWWAHQAPKPRTQNCQRTSLKKKKDLPTELTHMKTNKCPNKQTKATSLFYSRASGSHARRLPIDTTFLEKILMTEHIYQCTYFTE